MSASFVFVKIDVTFSDLVLDCFTCYCTEVRVGSPKRTVKCSFRVSRNARTIRKSPQQVGMLPELETGGSRVIV